MNSVKLNEDSHDIYDISHDVNNEDEDALSNISEEAAY